MFLDMCTYQLDIMLNFDRIYIAYHKLIYDILLILKIQKIIGFDRKIVLI